MTDIDPQHIDAVASVIDPPAFSVRAASQERWDACRAIARDAAEALLTTSDPAVHAAMLDALTRHGVLTREGHCDAAYAELREFGGTRIVTCGEYGGDEVCPHRYVTAWTEVTR